MKTKILRINNESHKTYIDLKVKHIGIIEVKNILYLSSGQIKKAKKVLCNKGCSCSIFLGNSESWHKLGHNEVKLEIEEMSNGSARIYIAEILD